MIVIIEGDDTVSTVRAILVGAIHGCVLLVILGYLRCLAARENTDDSLA